MTIQNARFVTSLDRPGVYPGQGAPEIAMAGKSNVGKSSAINRIARNGTLARVSGSPGKTRLLNIYAINSGALFWVDLPGYGFAKAPKSERDKWAGMIEGYLAGSEHLRHVMHFVDIRHEPTGEDKMMVDYLRHYQIPFTVFAGKCDKLSRAAIHRAIPLICRALTVQPWQVIPFSAEDGTGVDKALELFDKVLAEPAN